MSLGEVIGVVLTLAGFAVAFWQLHKTRTAAEATEKAVASTEEQMVKNELLGLLPALLQLEHEIDVGIGSKDKQAVADALARWREVANEVRQLLRQQSLASAEFIERLRDSAMVAAQRKSDLLSGGAELDSGVKTAHTVISEVCNDVGALRMQLKTQAQTGSGT